MNERYLFRGKRKDNGEWVTGYLIKGNNTYIVTPESIYYMVVSISYIASVEFVDVLPETVGQCTGLRDKNGNLIFDGDVIKGINDSLTIIVTWYYIHAGFNLMGLNTEAFEIIGNIHDNTELLEVSHV